jgi:sialic acid synthase SpsE
MQTMTAAFGVPAGYSDHTQGIAVALAAVALGACVIEKHFTLDRHLPGPDHLASVEPGELAAMVRGIRTVEAALGDGQKGPASIEASAAAVARKSLVASRDIPIGTVLTEDMIDIKRPGTGLPPAMRVYVVGRTARTSIPAGSLLTFELLV